MLVLLLALRNESYYVCEKCGAIYKEIVLARKCEHACNRGSCDLELTSQAVGWLRRSLSRIDIGSMKKL